MGCFLGVLSFLNEIFFCIQFMGFFFLLAEHYNVFYKQNEGKEEYLGFIYSRFISLGCFVIDFRGHFSAAVLVYFLNGPLNLITS